MSGTKIKFKTLPNNGSTEGLRNTCMFISIYDFLYRCEQSNLNIDKMFTVNEMRKFCNFPGSKTDFFDINSVGHIESLEKLLKHFDIELHVFYENVVKDDKGIVTDRWISGDNAGMIINKGGKHKMSLLATGGHFELIVSETSVTKELTLKTVLSLYKNIFDDLCKLTDDSKNMLVRLHKAIHTIDATLVIHNKNKKELEEEYDEYRKYYAEALNRRKEILNHVNFEKRFAWTPYTIKTTYEKRLDELNENIKKFEDDANDIKKEYIELLVKIDDNTKIKNHFETMIKVIQPICTAQ